MTLDYYLILFVDDSNRDQAWPIGVIANDGLQAYIRMLGARSRHDVDHTPLCYLTGLNAANAWAYREWVDWFYDVSENECANPAGFQKVMSELQATGTTITAEPGGTVEVPEGQTPDMAMDRLFVEQVNP